MATAFQTRPIAVAPKRILKVDTAPIDTASIQDAERSDLQSPMPSTAHKSSVKDSQTGINGLFLSIKGADTLSPQDETTIQTSFFIQLSPETDKYLQEHLEHEEDLKRQSPNPPPSPMDSKDRSARVPNPRVVISWA